MPFSLVKAIKSSHKTPVNRILHCIGLPVYADGIMLIVGYFIDLHTNPITGITYLVIEWLSGEIAIN